MTSAIAILTFNRLNALKLAWSSAIKNCHDGGQTRFGIFEDCGNEDTTRAFLRSGHILDSKHLRQDILAHEVPVSTRNVEIFLGTENLGVAGNSNRALKWFMDNTKADHLLLCNDDIEFKGDAIELYRKAHIDTGIGLFCFCDFTSPQYACTPLVFRGTRLKRLKRMTGLMMSLTRKAVEDIGYFDPQFGRFGEEHCHYTVRARMARHQDVMGIAQYAIDVQQPENPTIVHQEVKSTITAEEKTDLDKLAGSVMVETSKRLPYTDPYRPFTLRRNHKTDAMNGMGTETDLMVGYTDLPN